MASKLRRTLLVNSHFNFATDPPSSKQAPEQPQRRSYFNGSKSCSSMECGLSSSPAAANSAGHRLSSIATNGSSPTNKAKSELHVNFQPESKDMQDRRKYLTAKYGPHQMNLIRKRLAVESWLYDQLIYIFDDKDCEVELDLDELLDIDDVRSKRMWVQEKLINAKRSQDDLQKFTDELLVRAATL